MKKITLLVHYTEGPKLLKRPILQLIKQFNKIDSFINNNSAYKLLSSTDTTRQDNI